MCGGHGRAQGQRRAQPQPAQARITPHRYRCLRYLRCFHCLRYLHCLCCHHCHRSGRCFIQEQHPQNGYRGFVSGREPAVAPAPHAAGPCSMLRPVQHAWARAACLGPCKAHEACSGWSGVAVQPARSGSSPCRSRGATEGTRRRRRPSWTLCPGPHGPILGYHGLAASHCRLNRSVWGNTSHK